MAGRIAVLYILILVVSPCWRTTTSSPSDAMAPHPSQLPGLVGVTYNPNNPNIPSPSEVVKALVRARVPRVRLINPSTQSISAFADSGIDLNLSIENLDLFKDLAINRSTALNWVSNNVARHRHTVWVSSISVGFAILTRFPLLSVLLLPAVKNVHYACRKLGLQNVSVSSAHAFEIVAKVFPPSSAEFEASAMPYLRDLLDFEAGVHGVFHINLFPLHVYRKKLIDGATMAFVMFEAREDQYLVDPATNCRYRNVYDIMVDGAVGALARLGHPEMPILVVGTGWPSSGDRKVIPEANLLYAAEYNERVVATLNMFLGTPLRRAVTPVTYIFELFDEPKNESSRSLEGNWGIMRDNLELKYDINFEPRHRRSHGRRAVFPGRWCVVVLIAALLPLL